ncbi:MAG: hypothetical protein B0A82_03700 [Alkalinema sp. CACIAM 70d]|nr:MAG: hypothetical protein B0A82_03700 [Alkalinema sp. CACIAM 70d]
MLDKLGQVFERDLKQLGIHWLALNDDERRAVALQVLSQVPVLWIWDNVEPVVGFPDGETQHWSEAEQQGLADFLRDARNTKARFLLTSRRDERAWLGDLPVRVQVPPMPTQERVEFARQLAGKYGYHLTDVGNWLPLLKYTQGNPLTITVVVGQALRNGYRSKEQIEKFVSDLRSGEAELEDDESEGRSRSLGSSLNYGFSNAFSEAEQQQLALLQSFQGFVNVNVFCAMGYPDNQECVPVLRNVTREQGIELLDRAVAVGILTKLGNGFYNIHPALPRYFKKLCNQYYPLDQDNISSLATRAFVEVMSQVSHNHSYVYKRGQRDAINMLVVEESNLLHAKHLAKISNQQLELLLIMSGLRTLYNHRWQIQEFSRLVEDLASDFVDSTTNGSLPGYEREWDFITEQRVWIACRSRKWLEAEQLQLILLNWRRKRAAYAFTVSSKRLEDTEHLAIQALAVSLNYLGEIQRELGQPSCIEAYKESITLSERIGERTLTATTLLNLGHAYKDILTIRDLEQAEKCYQRGLELCEKHDQLLRSKLTGQLGKVAFERFQDSLVTAQVAETSSGYLRFRDTQANPQAIKESFNYFRQAARFLYESLNLLPLDAVRELAVIHTSLVGLHGFIKNIDQAVFHSREAIRYYEVIGESYSTAFPMINIASALERVGRHEEALIYAQTSLRILKPFGNQAISHIQTVQELIEDIENSLTQMKLTNE